MVKYLAIFFIIILLQFSISAQDRPKANIYSSFNLNEEVKVHFIYDITKKQHGLGFGFNLPINPSVSKFGIDYSYKYFTSKNPELFNWFFLYHGQVNRRKLHSFSTTKGISWVNTIGYGFQLYITPSISILHQLEAGIEKSWFTQNLNFNDAALSINLGIGLNIGNKK